MKTIFTENLFIRPYTDSDKEVFEKYLNDPGLNYPSASVLHDRKRKFDFIMKNNEYGFMAITLKEVGMLIGHAEIYEGKYSSGGEVEFTFVFSNKKYNVLSSETCKALLQFGFKSKKAKKILAAAEENETYLLNAFEDSGMKLSKEIKDKDRKFLIYFSEPEVKSSRKRKAKK
jgi:hypothetical protein